MGADFDTQQRKFDFVHTCFCGNNWCVSFVSRTLSSGNIDGGCSGGGGGRTGGGL